MKNVFFTLAIIIIGSNCFSKNNDLKTPKTQKLSYEELITQFGIDDTSKAIINFYFDKRENCGTGKMTALPLSAGIAIFVPPIGIVLTAISTPLFISGIITKNKFNDKHLMKALMDYQNDHILSSKLKDNITDLMADQKEFYSNELNSYEPMTLKAIRETNKSTTLYTTN